METPVALVNALEDIVYDALAARDSGRAAYEGTFESLLVIERRNGSDRIEVFRSRRDLREALEQAMPMGVWLALAWWPLVAVNLRSIGHRWWAEAEATTLGAAVRPAERRTTARI